MNLTQTTTLRRLYEIDLGICHRLNRLVAFTPVKNLFALVSRLGNGVFWYVLMLCLPFFYGLDGLRVSAKMLAAAMIGLLLYKVIKSSTARLRPHAVSNDIALGTAPLDYYSFPSGHTLHAVSFSIICLTHYPQLYWLLVPFTALIGLSRVVLGLHFPTDVVAGTIIGCLTAWLALALL